MLTPTEFEKLKSKLSDVERALSVEEAKKQQALERLETEYGLTLETAREEVARLEREIPELEERFNEEKRTFDEKWAHLIRHD